MSGSRDQVESAIDRWEHDSLIDADMAATLRGEIAKHAESSSRRLSQYILASTGAVVLVIAGGVFLDWAWPLVDERGRTLILAVIGIGVLAGGVRIESASRWLPASLLMQTAGIGLLLASYVYSERAWADQTMGGVVVGIAALVTPVVLTARSMRRSVFMPAVHMAASLAFLGIFLDRATGLSGDTIVWILDAVLAGAIAVLVLLVRNDPDGEQHPWALNAFVLSMAAGFALVSVTAFGTLNMSEDGFLPLDAWLALSVMLTLWGLHRAPRGLRREWFERLLALEVLGWIGLGLATVAVTFDWSSEMGVVLVGGAGVAAFLHADRHGMREVMAVAALAFIIPVWWWAVDRAGALGGVLALAGTAGLLFWASGRWRGAGREDDASTPG